MNKQQSNLLIRLVNENDLESICAIYNYFIKKSLYTMDTKEKSIQDMLDWYQAHIGRYPAIVGIVDNKIIGVAYLSKWAERPGYDQSCEISIYLSPERAAQGYGLPLLNHLITYANTNRFTTIVAFITSTNKLAIRLSKLIGFKYVGTLNKIGIKNGNKIDLDIYQFQIQKKMILQGGTAYDRINQVLKNYNWFVKYKGLELTQNKLLSTLIEHKRELIEAGLNEDQIHLATRFSLNDEETVDAILNDLKNRDIIESTDYPKDYYSHIMADITSNFKHASYLTYIFPEEARLLFALTYIKSPKVMVFLGSYYGYWAIWAAFLLKKQNGMAYLIDIDKDALQLARKNMKHFALEKAIELVHQDGIHFMQTEKIAHDFLVIDPEGPKTSPDPDLLDKAIYYPMARAAHPYLKKNGIVLCHNILLNHTLSSDNYFKKKIQYNHDQFKKFLPFMREHYSAYNWYDTTEGTGIFKK